MLLTSPETLVDISGYIVDANILEPQFHIYMEQPKFKLTLRCEPDYEAKEIAARADWIKMTNANPYDKMANPHFGTKEDAFHDGFDLLYFETIRKPSLMDEFRSITNDHELLGKFCKVMGHIKYMKDGNCYLSVHLIEPKLPPVVEGVEIGDDENADDYDW